MNGISLVDLREFFQWYFSQVPFITADPADIDKHFFGFNYDEKIGGESKFLKNVIAGLSQKTHSGLEGKLQLQQSVISEPMSLDVSVVKKITTGSFSEQEAAFDACKTVLFDFVTWAFQQASTSMSCDYPILKYIDFDQISHAKLTNVGGGFYGWKISLYVKQYINTDINFNPVTAPPLWDVPEGSVAVFEDGKWTYTTIAALRNDPICFTATAGQNDYTAADLPELADKVGMSLVIVGFDSGNLRPTLFTWDNTTFHLADSITLDGTEYITLQFKAP